MNFFLITGVEAFQGDDLGLMNGGISSMKAVTANRQ